MKQREYSTDYIGFVEVKNTGTELLTFPTATVKFLSEDGTLLETTEETIFTIKPGQKWEARAMFLGTDATPAKIKATLDEGTDRNWTEYTPPEELKMSNVQLHTGKEPSITGKVTNTSKTKVGASAYGMFLKEDGDIVAGGSDRISDLSPGQSWAMNIESLMTNKQLAQKVAKYDLYLGVA